MIYLTSPMRNSPKEMVYVVTPRKLL